MAILEVSHLLTCMYTRSSKALSAITNEMDATCSQLPLAGGGGRGVAGENRPLKRNINEAHCR